MQHLIPTNVNPVNEFCEWDVVGSSIAVVDVKVLQNHT